MLENVIHPTVPQMQDAPYTCGAACINMALSFWGNQQPQQQIWAEIQANTGGKRPSDAQPQAGSFSSQHCDHCGGGPVLGQDGKYYGNYLCWFTTPEAAATTLNAWAPQHATGEYAADCAAAIVRVVDSLAATDPVPALFTIKPALHWVVAVGYQIDGPGSSVQWKGKSVTGLYVRDPQDDPGRDVIRLMTVFGLCDVLFGVMMAVECGPHGGARPVVVKGVGPPTWLVRLVTVFLRPVPRFLIPAWLRRFRPPPRPWPPPPPVR
jgi:hypothetical protein